MERFKRFHSRLPHQTPYLVFLFLVFLGIFITNFPGEGRFLTGWDNLHPEFNFGLNIRRAFDIWQSNQGVGLVGGHGYSATLPHTLSVFLLSFIFPVASLRALFTFLMLLIGAFGVFFVTRHVLTRNQEREEFSLSSSSLIASLFYMLSIGTVQNFYIQLEAFIVHFAFLPWLVLTLFNFLEKPRRRNLALFVIANVLILPAQFIPPLFIVEGIIVASILAMFYLSHRKVAIKRGVVALLAIFLVNAYWLLPFSYYTLFHSKNYLNAYNNIQSTSEFIQKNLKYGDIENVPILRSFLFEANDIDTAGNLFPILKPWIDHLKNPLILGLSYGLFILGILGVIFLLKKRNLDFSAKSMLLIFGIVFTLFATDIIPFSFVSSLLRMLSSLFEQAFRVTFTKISIAYVFSLSFFIGLGYAYISSRLRVKRAKQVFFTLLTLLLIIYAAPSFNGNFIYKSVKTQIPQDYFSLFSYMNERPEAERIMNLSQGWNWGWTLYNWGYTGSGFLWYGASQPILDRAFDVWSPYNENYYWEVERALFSKDFGKVDSLLEKYQISWVIYDPTVVSYPGERQPIYREAVGEYLENSHNFSLEKDFGKVKLYKVNLVNRPQNDILQYSHLPNALPIYNWTNIDEAAALSGMYYSSPRDEITSYFPFRSVFTSRKVGEEEFGIEKVGEELRISNKISSDLKGKTAFQDYSDPFVPARVKVDRIDNNNFEVRVSYKFPAFMDQAAQEEKSWNVFVADPKNLSLNVNSDFFPLTSYGQFIPMDKVIILSASKNNVFNFLNDEEIPSTQFLSIQVIPLSLAQLESENIAVNVPFTSGQLSYNSFDDPSFYNHQESNCVQALTGTQKVANEGNASSLLFISRNEEKRCFDIILDNLSQSTGYIIEVQSKHIAGEALGLAIVSQQPKKTEFQVSLPKDNKFKYSYIVIPAMQRDGLGYSLHFENISTVRGDSINELRSVRVTPIPYSYLTKLRIGELAQVAPIGSSYNSKKILPGLYKFDVAPGAKFIVLSQAYDKGWVAFGEPAGEHVLVNNWENGWKTEGSGEMYVFFLPQILVFIGFGLSLGVIILILKKRREQL